MTAQPPPGQRRVLPILGLVGGLAPLSIDMYLPALPDMARSLDASDAMLQMTVTAFLVGFALGPLVLGPVSDAVGRRAVMLAAIAVFVVASLLCARARSAEELIAYRILQAVSGGSAATLSGAVVNDLFEGDRVARAMSILMLIMSVAPMVAPKQGGQLLVASSTGLGGLWGIAVTVFWVVGLAHIMGVLSFFGGRAGAASAVNGALRFLAGVTATLMVSALNDGTSWSLAAVIMGCAVISATATAVALRGRCGGTADAGA